MTSIISLSRFYTSNLHIIRPKLVLSTRTTNRRGNKREAFIPDSGNRAIVDINWYDATASASTNDATIQYPGEISAMMTQASDGIQNELASQGDKLNNQLVNTFGFN